MNLQKIKILLTLTFAIVLFWFESNYVNAANWSSWSSWKNVGSSSWWKQTQERTRTCSIDKNTTDEYSWYWCGECPFGYAEINPEYSDSVIDWKVSDGKGGYITADRVYVCKDIEWWTSANYGPWFDLCKVEEYGNNSYDLNWEFQDWANCSWDSRETRNIYNGCYIFENWEIKDYLCSWGSVTIPSVLWWKTVTSIWTWAMGDKWITNLTLPNTIKTIGAFSFGVNSLKSLTIPSSVEVIYDYAFQYNKLSTGSVKFKCPLPRFEGDGNHFEENPGYIDTSKCDTGKVNWGWSGWSSWSNVWSVNTSTWKIKQKRTRSCSNPAPQGGWKYCSWNNSETRYVNHPVNWGWTAWTGWVQYADTDEATWKQPQERTRACTNPTPKNWWASCSWKARETRISWVAVNWGWTAWTPWANVSLQNPNWKQRQLRSRTCTDPSPANWWKYCEWSSTEYKTVDWKVDWGWTAWSAWSNVWVAADWKQSQQRTRSCTNPTPKNNWLYCSGVNSQTRTISVSTNDSGWYKRHTHPIRWWKTECNYDNDGTGWYFPFRHWARDRRVISQRGSYIYCDYYDKQKSTLSSNFLTPYANSTAEYRFTMNDKWGSGLKTVILYSKNLKTGQQVKIATWWGLNWVKTKSFTKLFSVWAEGKYQMVVSVIDVAWNSANIQDTSKTLLVDKTKPTTNDLTWTIKTNNNKYFRATNSQNFSWNIGKNWWAPIKSFKIQFENYLNPIQLRETTFKNANWNISYNISKVDNNLIPSDGYRDFTLKVIDITDKAWNVWDGWIYHYRVYANVPDLGNSIFDINGLTNSNNIADWIGRNITITPKDRFGNLIRTVKWQRSVKISPNYGNSVKVNQYKNSWVSAIYDSNSINSSKFREIALSSNQTKDYYYSNNKTNSWLYNLYYKAYAPTKSSYSKAIWNFVLKNIKIQTNDKWLGNSDFTKTLNTISKFKPLFTNTIIGEIAELWIIEGATQSSAMSFIKATPNASVSNTKYNINYTDSGRGRLYLNWSSSSLSNNLNSLWHQETSFDGNSSSVKSFKTKYVSNNVLAKSNKIEVHSYIQYVINGLSVIYKADAIWTNSNETISKQTWIQIKWTTRIKDGEKAIVSEEKGWKTVEKRAKIIEWEIDSSKVKQLIKFNVAKAKRSINLKDTKLNSRGKIISNLTNNLWSNIWWILASEKWDIIYFWGLFDSNKLVKIDSELEISWSKTVIIEWWNLYINNNMYYKNKKTDSVWFIVLKDSNWNGGNVYIDPKVTNVVWAFYAEGSVISYDWIKNEELDWKAEYSILKNQLHIFGTLMTQNTIWGSRESTPRCPYNVSPSNCNSLEKAQKYDLQYLRRYFIDKNGNPAWEPYVIGWGKYNKSSNTITWYKTKFVKYFDNPHDAAQKSELAYPIIIEYNPNIQITPPPLFSE